MQKAEVQKRTFLWSPNESRYATSHTGHQRSRTAMKEFAKAKEDNGMMNIKDVLSPGEEVLFGTQQHRLSNRWKRDQSRSDLCDYRARDNRDIKVAWPEERVSGSTLQRYHECCVEEEHLERQTSSSTADSKVRL